MPDGSSPSDTPRRPTRRPSGGARLLRSVDFRNLVENLGVGFSVVDAAETFLFANATGERIFGVKRGGLKGRRVAEFLDGENLTRVEREMEVRRTGDVSTYELEIRRPDGERRWILLTAAPEFEDGTLVHTLGIYRDVTEERRVQAALQESEGRYRDLVEKAGVAIINDDDRGAFPFFNRTFSDLFGYTAEEMAAQTIATLVHPDDLDRVLAAHRARLEGRPAAQRYRFRGLRKDGTVIHLEVDATEVRRDGAIVGTHSYLWDVTGSARMEEELRRHRDRLEELVEARTAALKESEEKFRAVVEQSAECIYLVDIATARILDANPAFRRLLGYDRDDLGGLTTYDVVAHDRDDVDTHIRRIVDAGSEFVGERRWRKKDGDTVEVEVSAARISLREREVICVVARDVTERKRSEEERERLHRQLLQSQKLEAVGLLAGGIAHDFNNLLTTILGQTDLALLSMDRGHPLYEHLHEAQQASMRAAALTRQLLLFSRRQPMEMVKLNINRTVDNLLRMLRRFIGEDVAIRTDLDPALWNVRADEGNIEQVIINLAVNARDALVDGGGITLRTDNAELDAGSPELEPGMEPGRYVRLTLEDTGQGIPPDVLERIFEPFFSTKAAGKGTGLGLSVAYGIIKQHGGWIRVSSEPGKGSSFRVYLTAVSGWSDEIRKDVPSREPPRGAGERILVVEDGRGIRRFAARALAEHGYAILEAETVADARALVEKEGEGLGVVFCDVVLPDGSGLALVDELTQSRPDLRVLLTSGYVDHKSQWPVIRERGFRFLQKPYALADLLAAVREVIESG